MEAGEEIVISRGGTPVARLLEFETPAKKTREFGLDRGRVWMAPDFNGPDPEIEE